MVIVLFHPVTFSLSKYVKFLKEGSASHALCVKSKCRVIPFIMVNIGICIHVHIYTAVANVLKSLSVGRGGSTQHP